MIQLKSQSKVLFLLALFALLSCSYLFIYFLYLRREHISLLELLTSSEGEVWFSLSARENDCVSLDIFAGRDFIINKIQL